MKKSLLWTLVFLLIASFNFTGCATKKFVRQEVAQELAPVKSDVQANKEAIAALKEENAKQDQMLKALSDNVKEALLRADEAGKLAKGKFLYTITMSDDSIQFGFDRDELSPAAKAFLDDFANKIKSENKNVYIEIQGHTDNIGSAEYNLLLGKRRAEAVKKYLYLQHNFPLHRMSCFSYGDTKPLVPNNSKENRAKNRRVTIVVME
ncbi:MAG: OmpA family protein [Candidatus Aminicenantes bacterium]|nr:OmpA family protein [Candidatus Aminicenantes bacterium]